MKKGLFSILAGALLVVGCQNYDDQFSNIESQITALASQVAGLSQVQSDLTALAGTVNSLQSSVAQTVDAALADGLADIDTAVASLEAATANAASAEDVAAIATAVADNQTDLDELLANSSVFNGSVLINSPATLAAFKSIGGGLAIVNGSVTINVSAAMNQADVQTVVDEILTVTGDFTYNAGASTIAETTFNNLSGAQSITLKQGGGYQMKTLASASNIVLNDQYKSTVTIVDFRALSSVVTIQDDNGVAGTLKFNKATEIHLTSLALYTGANLNLQCKEGGVIDLTALDDLNAAGTAVGASYNLSLDGPATASNANIGDGTLTFTNVATVSVSGFIGKTVIGAGVENLTIDGAVEMDISGGADLVTASITGALDSDPLTTPADKVGPAVDFKSQDLTTATVAGIVGAITVASQSNLETLTITADTNGAATIITGNNDLITLSTAGAKLGDVTLGANTDLEAVSLTHTTELATADKGATVSITGNTNMTSLTWSADDVDSLTVTGNTQLATVDFAGLADDGTAASASVSIKTNALVAASHKDAFDAAAATVDTGSFDAGTSGMATLKVYLDHVIATSTSAVGVYFDTLELIQSQASATAAYADVADYVNSTTGNTRNAYAYQIAAVPDTTPTVRETESVAWEGGVNALRGYESLGAGEGVKISYGSVDKIWAQGGTPAYTTVDDLITAINADTTFGSGITITAARDAYAKSYNKVSYTDASGAAETTASTGTVLWALGTVTGTATIGTGSSAANLATQLAAQITGTVVSGVQYGAVASSDEVILTRVVTNTQNVDLGVNSADFPNISIDLGNATFTTVDFAANTNTNSTGVNSDFFISFTQTNRNGLRVTVKNNSTAVALAATVTAVSPGTALVTLVPTELASGTNMAGNTSYDAGFSEITTPGSGAAAVTADRTGWL